MLENIENFYPDSYMPSKVKKDLWHEENPDARCCYQVLTVEEDGDRSSFGYFKLWWALEHWPTSNDFGCDLFIEQEVREGVWQRLYRWNWGASMWVRCKEGVR